MVGNEVAVSLEGVTKTYGEGPLAVSALYKVDLEIAAGELVVVLGPSGSGKTTLLNVIGGIETPSSGRVEVCGHDLAKLDADGQTAFRRDVVGFVFQFFNLVPTLTATENIELVLELLKKGAATPAGKVLEEVGLAERADHFPAQLSGGEQQRVAIARAISKQPPLMLCDEPTGALDLDTGRRILGVLRQLNVERGCTVLIVTHNSAIARMADRVVRMHSGEIVEERRSRRPVAPEKLTW